MKYSRLLIIGFGHVGKWLYDYIRGKGFCDIQFIDKVPKLVNGPIDVMHVCIPYSEDFVKETSSLVLRFEPQLTIVHSTVIPGTTREIFKRTGACVVHSPIRGKQDNFWKWKKFVGAVKADHIDNAKEHLSDLDFDVEVLDNAETTEFGKLFDTAFYAVCIAWHQEMDRICKKYGISYEQSVTEFSSTFVLDPRFVIPRPLLWSGVIGKECLVPNAQLLMRKFPSQILEAVLNSNELRRKELSNQEEFERVEAQRISILERDGDNYSSDEHWPVSRITRSRRQHRNHDPSGP